MKNKDRPLVIAHRGYSAMYPENTLPAIQAAIDLNVDMIEIDVHLSRDHEILITHDARLGRTIKDAKGWLQNYDAHEIRKYDAGSWFGEQYKGLHIPYLWEVLELCKGRCLLNIEVKRQSLSSEESFHAMAQKVHEKVSKHSHPDNVLISSYNPILLWLLRQKSVDYKLGVLAGSPKLGLYTEEISGISAYSYHCYHKGMKAEDVEYLHSYGVKVFPFTVNSENRYTELLDMGVDGIFTDEVELLLETLKKRKNLSRPA